MDQIELNLLEEVSGLHSTPMGAFNIRVNGQSADRKSTKHIDIIPYEDKSGLEIHVKPETKNESLHIPVIMSKAGLKETVYNDFYIGENCDITIIAGCGIHNPGDAGSEHSGIHTFYIGKNSRVKYVERHYGSGDGRGERVMNPTTVVHIDENGYMEMDTTQIKGIDSTVRTTKADLKDGATLIINEKIMTHGSQLAKTDFSVDMNGAGSNVNLISRSVARENSHQVFLSTINGNNKCTGHSECDAIIMDQANVEALPGLSANHVDASLIHEAAIGKIAGEQLIKLMTLGLTEEQAEAQIINGFLK